VGRESEIRGSALEWEKRNLSQRRKDDWEWDREDARRLGKRIRNSKRWIDRDLKHCGRDLPENFSAEKCLDKLQPRGRIKHATQELTTKSEFESEPSVGPETGRRDIVNSWGSGDRLV